MHFGLCTSHICKIQREWFSDSLQTNAPPICARFRENGFQTICRLHRYSLTCLTPLRTFWERPCTVQILTWRTAESVLCFMLVSCLAYAFTMKMATYSNEMTGDFQWTTYPRILHNHWFESQFICKSRHIFSLKIEPPFLQRNLVSLAWLCWMILSFHMLTWVYFAL
jgi:hypothetical protein